MPRRHGSPENERVERIMFAIVVGVMPLVALLVFFFSFGNVGLLGVGLGVDHKIAFLTGPAIDLSVAGLVIAASYLSSRGWTEKQLWPLHLMAALCGIVMIALNDGDAVYEHHWRLAAFDTVGPALLIGWAAIGPWLLRQLMQARRVPVAAPEAVAPPATVAAPAITPAPETARPAPTPASDAPNAPLPLPAGAAATASEAAPASRPATATADATGHARVQQGAPPPAAPPKPAPSGARMSTPTDRQAKIRRLINERGRDNVDGALVGKELGVHRSNGRLALKNFLEALDAGQISLDEDADESDRELVTA